VEPDFVAAFAPFSNANPVLWQSLKPLLTQAFVSEFSIETLEVAVLHGSAELNQNVTNVCKVAQAKNARLVNSGQLSVRTATG
jgi:hypothetical protein